MSADSQYCKNPFRGSRKLVLDLLDDPHYVEIMNGMLATHGVHVSPADAHCPTGWRNPSETYLRAFCADHCRNWFRFADFDTWWVSNHFKNTTWDLLSTCIVEQRRGLLAVEVKAHLGELSRAGKRLAVGASGGSTANHEQIKACIAEAQASLRARFPDIHLSSDDHYQLSNRVAHAWKLAQCGLPTVLLYLGFTGDDSVGKPITSAKHWGQALAEHWAGVLPDDFVGQSIKFDGGASLQMLVKTLPADPDN